MKKICFIAQFPPPMHGLSKAVETLYNSELADEFVLEKVDMPIAVEFAQHVKVIGFNHNARRIQQYKRGIDPTNEVGNDAIKATTVDFTSDETRLKEASFSS